MSRETNWLRMQLSPFRCNVQSCPTICSFGDAFSPNSNRSLLKKRYIRLTFAAATIYAKRLNPLKKIKNR